MTDLLPGDVISDSIALTGMYELAASLRTVELGRQGGLLVDAGANLGYFSLLWAAANPANKVIAIEASPRNLPLLGRNVEYNRLAGQVDIVPAAVGRAAGKLQFNLGPPDQTGWGGVVKGDSDPDCVTVDVKRIDDLVADGKYVDLLKIDIEGADTWALMGCEELLRERRIGEVWFEENQSRMGALGIGRAEALEFLASVGYEATVVDASTQGIIEWRAFPAGRQDARSARPGRN